MNSQLSTPVAFFIFKRPNETKRVFETIRNVRPEKLLIIADGPRNNEEKKLCLETQKIVEKIDWPCVVSRNYSEINLGCKNRISSGIDWVFKNVKQAIILEDDCLPDQSFFYFCQELLNKYSEHQNIMHISGLNVQSDNPNYKNNASYYFSNIAQIWGWATWKRAWDKYDVNMKDWPQIKKTVLWKNILNNPPARDYFEYLFDRMYRKELDTWDVAWTYTCMKEQGLSIVPNLNLIKNIGFGDGATHKIVSKSYLGNMETKTMALPLIDPLDKRVNIIADNHVLKKIFGVQSRISQKILWLIKSNSPGLYRILRFIFQKIKLLMK